MAKKKSKKQANKQANSHKDNEATNPIDNDNHEHFSPTQATDEPEPEPHIDNDRNDSETTGIESPRYEVPETEEVDGSQSKLTFEESVYAIMDRESSQSSEMDDRPPEITVTADHYDDTYEEPDESEFVSDHVNVIPPSRPVSMAVEGRVEDDEDTENQPPQPPVAEIDEPAHTTETDELSAVKTSLEEEVPEKPEPLETESLKEEELARVEMESDETHEKDVTGPEDTQHADHESEEVHDSEEVHQHAESIEPAPAEESKEQSPPREPIKIDTTVGDTARDPIETPDFYSEELETPVVQQAVPLSFGSGRGLGIDTSSPPSTHEAADSPETSPVARVQAVDRKASTSSQHSTSSLNSQDSSEQQPKRANGNAKLVSRLVSNFESQIQEDTKKPAYGKRGDEKFSRSRARMIGQSLMNGVGSPPTSPTLDDDQQEQQQQSTLPKSRSMPINTGGNQRRKMQGGQHLRQLSLSSKSEEEKKQRYSLIGLGLGKGENSIAGRLKNFALSAENDSVLNGAAAGAGTAAAATTSSVAEEDEGVNDANGTDDLETNQWATVSKHDEDVPKHDNENDRDLQNVDLDDTEAVPRNDLELDHQEKSQTVPEPIPAPVPVPVPMPAVAPEEPEPEPEPEQVHTSTSNEARHSGSSLADELKQEMREDSHSPPLSTAGDDETPTAPLPPPLPPKDKELNVSLKPIEVEEPIVEEEENVIFGVCVVGFHHHRGPEVEYWVGPDGDKSSVWPYLPFQSLPDGSHSHEENFCYFTLLYDKKTGQAPVIDRDEEGNITDGTDMSNVTTLFGIACNRQVPVSEIKHMTSDITRSTVQKSVVVVARKPIFGPIKEKLAVVTRAFFMQGDFEDKKIIETLYENLTQIFSHKLDENDLNVGMPLRELVYRLGPKLLIIMKALLLEKKILFFASNTELLCASQFSLVSLIPNLINHLEDCGSPLLNTYEARMKKPTSLKTSDRGSLLAFMGLPLQIFADGGIFNPYVPLQQLDELKAPETRYFMVGSTNSLLIAPNQDLADVVVNMDLDNVEVMNPELSSALTLSPSDKKWMDTVVKAVNDSWDEEDPWRPKGLGFVGSEDYIRVQFEDYIINMLSSVKYDQFLTRRNGNTGGRVIQGNPIKLYNASWVDSWRLTNNYRIFSKFTDEELFDIVQPKHLAELAPNVLDIQRQIIEPRPEDKPQQQPQGGLVSRVFGSFWANGGGNGASATTPPQEKKDDSKSPSVSPPRSTVHSSSASISSTVARWSQTHRAAASTDQLSLAESARSASTESSQPDQSSQQQQQQKEGWVAGWSRWAATKRRQLKTGSTATTASNVTEEDSKSSPSPGSQSIKSVDLNEK